MKKAIVILISITLLLVLLFTISYFESLQINELPETTLKKSFDASGAKILNSEIYFWSKLNSRNNNMDNLKALSSSLSRSLGIIENNMYSSNFVNNDLSQNVEIRGTTSSGTIAVIKIQLSKNTGNSNESFISVSVNEDLSHSGLENARKSVCTVLRKNGINPKINSCMTGSFEGKLDQNSLNDISKKILKEVKATNIEGIRDGNLISVSAYSPFIRESVKVNGSKINLNLAIRYNSFENRTYIWLATPVITTEY
jgi:galactitol-specific phosphotransferase system IIB component